LEAGPGSVLRLQLSRPVIGGGLLELARVGNPAVHLKRLQSDHFVRYPLTS
jgi:hypothetical protein